MPRGPREAIARSHPGADGHGEPGDSPGQKGPGRRAIRRLPLPPRDNSCGSGGIRFREGCTCKWRGSQLDWHHLLSNNPSFTATRDRFRKCCLVLHDDDFTHFVRHATEIVARVALEIETKTVKDGALFYEEFLPPESLFYGLVIAQAPVPIRRAYRSTRGFRVHLQGSACFSADRS